jgi:hypothetical protein
MKMSDNEFLWQHEMHIIHSNTIIYYCSYFLIGFKESMKHPGGDVQQDTEKTRPVANHTF